ncbi:MAG: hypothetical protein IPK76_03040 [Lewinellaceae bacterium]|nr:hypothetical protein [Lewinellaceae bacterium]
MHDSFQNKFRYYLKGAEPEWAHTSPGKPGKLPESSPGKYTFLIKGSNSDGVWNETPPHWKLLSCRPGIERHGHTSCTVCCFWQLVMASSAFSSIASACSTNWIWNSGRPSALRIWTCSNRGYLPISPTNSARR